MFINIANEGIVNTECVRSITKERESSNEIIRQYMIEVRYLDNDFRRYVFGTETERDLEHDRIFKCIKEEQDLKGIAALENKTVNVTLEGVITEEMIADMKNLKIMAY